MSFKEKKTWDYYQSLEYRAYKAMMLEMLKEHVLSGKPYAQFAKQHNIHLNTVYKWVHKDLAFPTNKRFSNKIIRLEKKEKEIANTYKILKTCFPEIADDTLITKTAEYCITSYGVVKHVLFKARTLKFIDPLPTE